MNWWRFFFRWLHVLSGVMWIGILWYFNFVQTPVDAEDPGRAEARGQQGHRAHGAVLVPLGSDGDPVTGLILANMYGYFVQALSLQKAPPRHRPGHVARPDHVVQRLVHHLAEPEEGARHRHRDAGGEGQGGARWPA